MVESKFHFLMLIGRDSSSYESMIIPVILKRLADLVKLVVTSKLGQYLWNITIFMECISSDQRRM